jgi:hypothetical protein
MKKVMQRELLSFCCYYLLATGNVEAQLLYGYIFYLCNESKIMTANFLSHCMELLKFFKMKKYFQKCLNFTFKQKYIYTPISVFHTAE